MSRARIRIEPSVPHGLMFHRFRSGEMDAGAQGAHTSEQFDRLLQFVGLHRILSPDEWLGRLESGSLQPSDVCVTFDDGLRSQRDHALPVLEQHGLRAFFFVCSCIFHGEPIWSEVYSHAAARVGGLAVISAALLDRCPPEVLAHLRSSAFEQYAAQLQRTAPWYSRQDLEYRFLRNRVLTATQYQSLLNQFLRERGVDPDEVARSLWLEEADLARLTAAGHYVGLHSWGHPYEMARLPADAQRDQYERNRAHLEAVTGRSPVAMAHPLNSYGTQTLAVLREMGVRCGFRANVAPPADGCINASPLELAREDSASLVAAMDGPA